ncbi:hypothetical protein CAPTEDRAFT_220583 [Capitella teleta]|uniref:F5/8 type C domain-containing protein n=1 Tax=Capitella teleta TaxID=283909 RepID=R7UZ38_CAPTE|nr:hypothetical protein CAPTEDRAFT_220583 [Capitella teleta]|eukprot:ELU11579.1 hypothetical protein CAPTEDRAFT_220583 [Capitella teleta]
MGTPAEVKKARSNAKRDQDSRRVNQSELNKDPKKMVVPKGILILLCLLFLESVLSEFDASCPCIGYEPLVLGVRDEQLSVSSWHWAHNKSCIKSSVLKGWAAADLDQTPWVEVDLRENKLLGGVVTWPRGEYKIQYVKTFSIQYRADGQSVLEPYMESGNIATFVGNENKQDIVLNGFHEKIFARHVRLNVLTFSGHPTMRLEILGCMKRVLPYVNNEYTSPALCDTSAEKCIRIRNNRIRVQWKGIVSALNSTNLVLSGKFMICNFPSTIVGIEQESTGCKVGYEQCKIEDANEDGKCQVWCHLKKWQVGQPFNLLILVTGDESTELCSVETDLHLWSPGRSVITDWDSFIQRIKQV